MNVDTVTPKTATDVANVSPAPKSGDDFQIDYRRSCMVPGVTHIGGCGESCQLARNAYDARLVAARYAEMAPIREASAAERVVEVHDGTTFVAVIPTRVDRFGVECLAHFGHDVLHLDTDAVLAGIAEARNAAVTR